MSFDVGKRALDFLTCQFRQQGESGSRFFWRRTLDELGRGKTTGGLRQGEQERIHDKTFRFTLTTNGVLLDEDVMESANREMSNVVLSIDGRKEA